MISFIDQEEYAPDEVVGDNLLEYELCTYLPEGGAARHAMQAWGQ